MTWKDEVRKQLIQYHQDEDTSEFSLQEFYAFSEDELSATYPNNNHVRAKIRQILQQLRDQGEIRFKDITEIMFILARRNQRRKK